MAFMSSGAKAFARNGPLARRVASGLNRGVSALGGGTGRTTSTARSGLIAMRNNPRRTMGGAAGLGGLGAMNNRRRSEGPMY